MALAACSGGAAPPTASTKAALDLVCRDLFMLGPVMLMLEPIMFTLEPIMFTLAGRITQHDRDLHATSTGMRV